MDQHVSVADHLKDLIPGSLWRKLLVSSHSDLDRVVDAEMGMDNIPTAVPVQVIWCFRLHFWSRRWISAISCA